MRSRAHHGPRMHANLRTSEMYREAHDFRVRMTDFENHLLNFQKATAGGSGGRATACCVVLCWRLGAVFGAGTPRHAFVRGQRLEPCNHAHARAHTAERWAQQLGPGNVLEGRGEVQRCALRQGSTARGWGRRRGRDHEGQAGRCALAELTH